jgi:hypothetical protein
VTAWQWLADHQAFEVGQVCSQGKPESGHELILDGVSAGGPATAVADRD